MQKRTVINGGKKYLVNVATDDGIGAGFALGQLVVKSVSDLYWYVVVASGSANNVTASISQSRIEKFGTSSYYDINYPYQLLRATNGNIYGLYLSGSAPTATLRISQSAYTGSAEPKPYLLLQNVTDGNYYRAYLSASGATITLSVNQTVVSASWVHPIY